MNAPLKVEKEKVVEIEYSLKDAKGTLLDATTAEKPLGYIHGANNIFGGMEEVLEGLEVGARFDATLPPEKIFGEYKEKLVHELSKDNFAEGHEFQLGQQFLVEGPNGKIPVFIKEIKEETVVIDGNHPLAGETILFAGKVLSIREATEEELQRGRLGAAGGCCGGHGHEDHGCCGGHEDEEHECCGGHGNEEHECCGGHGGDDHECCGGHGHEDDHECCGGHCSP